VCASWRRLGERSERLRSIMKASISAMTRRLLWIGIPLVAMLTGARLLLYQDCTSGGAMASVYRTCTCRGIEMVVVDQTAADGPRQTMCLGWVAARKCFRFREGPEVPCSVLP